MKPSLSTAVLLMTISSHAFAGSSAGSVIKQIVSKIAGHEAAHVPGLKGEGSSRTLTLVSQSADGAAGDVVIFNVPNKNPELKSYTSDRIARHDTFNWNLGRGDASHEEVAASVDRVRTAGRGQFVVTEVEQGIKSGYGKKEFGKEYGLLTTADGTFYRETKQVVQTLDSGYLTYGRHGYDAQASLAWTIRKEGRQIFGNHSNPFGQANHYFFSLPKEIPGRILDFNPTGNRLEVVVLNGKELTKYSFPLEPRGLGSMQAFETAREVGASTRSEFAEYASKPTSTERLVGSAFDEYMAKVIARKSDNPARRIEAGPADSTIAVQ